MKFELDENQRGAFHFLLLGVLVVGLPALIIHLVDASQTAVVTTDIHRLQVFRNGYLLSDPGLVASASSTRGERLVAGVLLGLAIGTVVAALCWLLRLRPGHWMAGRWSGGIAMAYFIPVALLLPVNMCAPSRGLLVRTGSRSIPRTDLPLPFTSHTDTILLGPEQLALSRGNGAWQVRLRSDDREILIASSYADSALVAAGVDQLRRIINPE